MLKDSLFKITSLNHQNNIINSSLEINKNDAIFKGHFPDHPILPGACMLQIIKEIIANSFEKSCLLKKADYMKFLKLINPLETTLLELTASYQLFDQNTIVVAASLGDAKDIYFKFKGTFIIAQ